jgi:hypothetical protein
MTVLDTVQTFAGITNENEFYSHHYLAEVFKGDIKARIDAWLQREQESGRDDDVHRAPFKWLASWSSRWFVLRGDLSKSRDPRERLTAFAELQEEGWNPHEMNLFPVHRCRSGSSSGIPTRVPSLW